MKENMLHNFCSQELQDGTGTDWARSAWKLLNIKVDLSPFLLMDLYTTTVVQQPPCTVVFETLRSNQMMAAILNLLMRSVQEDGYLKKCALARWRPNGDKIKCHVISQILTNRSLTLCNNSDKTLFSNTLTFARSLGRC